MSRPASHQPTPAELEVLKVLWQHGPCTVRQVMDRLYDERPRAYTSVMSLMATMADKRLLRRQAKGKAFIYAAAVPKDLALGSMVGDLVQRVFEGSPAALVLQLLDQANPTPEELSEIRRVIDEYRRGQQGEGQT